MLKYMATVKREGDDWLVDFPDAPGCQTFGASMDEALAAAAEALEGWLEAHLSLGRVPQQPKAGQVGEAVSVNPRLAMVLQLRWRRESLGISQAELAARAAVSQQQIAKLEALSSNPTLATLDKVARALGARVDVGLVSA